MLFSENRKTRVRFLPSGGIHFIEAEERSEAGVQLVPGGSPMLSHVRFWMTNLFSTSGGRKAPRRPNIARLGFETLEDRTVPSGTPLVGPFLPAGQGPSGAPTAAITTTSTSTGGPADT